MKTFNQFCTEAYQLNENPLTAISNTWNRASSAVNRRLAPLVPKPVRNLVRSPLSRPLTTALGATDIVDRASKGDIPGAALSALGTGSYLVRGGTPAGLALGGLSYMRDQDIAAEKRRKEAAQAQSASLPPGAKWYGRPEDDVRPKPNTSGQEGLLAKGRYVTRNYKGVGTQKP